MRTHLLICGFFLTLALPSMSFAEASVPWKQCKAKMTELCGKSGDKGRGKCIKAIKTELPGDCAEQHAERVAKKKAKKKEAKG